MIGSGSMRGVAISGDGTRVWATQATNQILVYDRATGDQLPSVTVEGGGTGGLHFFEQGPGVLFVAALDDNAVYAYVTHADNSLVFGSTIEAASPVGLARTQDGELWVSGHRNSDLLQRFGIDLDTDYYLIDSVDVTSSLGGVALLPGE